MCADRKATIRKLESLLVLGLLLVPSSAFVPSEPATEAETLGEVNFGALPQEPTTESRISLPISCNDKAQVAFDRGLFLLHNMMYVQAEAAFEAATPDDACAMLHWGIAMTQFHPKWAGGPTEQALEKGTAAVERARAIAGVSQVTDLERGFIDAVGAYYEDWRNSDRDTRRVRWREAQAALARKHPDSAEARIFFALAELTTAAPGDFESQLRAAERLEGVFEERPEHPGVLHYLLHAYDNPLHAHRGVPAARAYEKVAPDSPHALHMPSHLYVRLGDWEEVVAWNVRSRDAAARQPVEGSRVSRHFLHALDYLVYAYLQMGDDASAQRQAKRASGEVRWQLHSGPAAYALAAVPARFALERRAWREAAALEPRGIPYTWDDYPWAEAMTHAARGLGAARSGDATAARQAIEELGRLEALTDSAWWRGRIEVQRDVIASWIAHLDGDSESAVDLLRRAARRELAAGKQSVEPGHVLYAVEQLGELLLELDRPAEALDVFQRSLAVSARRFHSLFGAGRAAELAGSNEEATGYFAQLLDTVVGGSDRPQAKHAAEFLMRAKAATSSAPVPRT